MLAGEVILTFLNDGKGQLPAQRVSSRPGFDEIVEDALVEVSPYGRLFAGESLFNHIILMAWERGALHSLDLTRDDFSELLVKKGWRYNVVRHQWFFSENLSSEFQLTF